jgi:hypothetical protein
VQADIQLDADPQAQSRLTGDLAIRSEPLRVINQPAHPLSRLGKLGKHLLGTRGRRRLAQQNIDRTKVRQLAQQKRHLRSVEHHQLATATAHQEIANQSNRRQRLDDDAQPLISRQRRPRLGQVGIEPGKVNHRTRQRTARRGLHQLGEACKILPIDR